MPNCEETKAYADWLKDRGTGFTAGIKTAALDPFRGYANAIRDELPVAITVLDAFYSEVLVIPMSAGRGCWRGIPGGGHLGITQRFCRNARRVSSVTV